MLCEGVKVALVSRIGYASKFETEPIPDRVAIRDARRATTRAYQRTRRRPPSYALRPQTWKIKNLEIRRLHVNRVSVIYLLWMFSLSVFLSSLRPVRRDQNDLDDERRQAIDLIENYAKRKKNKNLQHSIFIKYFKRFYAIQIRRKKLII